MNIKVTVGYTSFILTSVDTDMVETIMKGFQIDYGILDHDIVYYKRDDVKIKVEVILHNDIPKLTYNEFNLL
jgi:hypothetical protein